MRLCSTCPQWQHVHYTGWQGAQDKDRNPPCCVNTRAKTSTRSNDTQTYIQNINAGTRTHPHICIPALMLTHSNTPAHIICMGRGTASAGVKQWTAFEPLTSVTHPYWWQAAHSLTTQRFSKHSMAPGTLGVNGGREEGSMDGWMNGGVNRQVKHIASQVYLSRCYGGITKRKIEEGRVKYVIPSRKV